MTDLYTDPRDSHPKRHVVTLLAALVAALVLGAVLADRVGADEERYEPAPRGSVERWRPLISQYDWNADTALAVIVCESGGDPMIPNRQGSGALGLFQIMPRWRYLARIVAGSDDFRDPSVNVRTAYELYVLFEGWSPWWSSRGCWGGW